ncbi:hypothetical protein [Kitasatospora sp. NPDC059327]|uniref:hypothetical protein n=1 Tax=Kitasatospora sp. NPDC059327 TaxID=3346803 RepID=UPI00369FA80A
MSPAPAPPPLPADGASRAWVRRFAGPLPLEEVAHAVGCSVGEAGRALTELTAAAGARDRTALVARYALAGHLARRDFGAAATDPGSDAMDRLILRMLARGLSETTIADEVGVTRLTAARYQAAAVARMGCTEVHQAVGLACLTELVRTSDLGLPADAASGPPADGDELLLALLPPVRLALMSGRAMAVAPRREQPALAALLARSEAGPDGRILVVARPGVHWCQSVEALAAGRGGHGEVAAVLTRDEADHPAVRTPPGVPVATHPAHLKRLVGSTLPATVIVSPGGLAVARAAWDTARHQRPYDLLVALDAHLPDIAAKAGRYECSPPAQATVWLTSTPRLVSTDRTRIEGADLYATGPITAALTPRQVAGAGRMRELRIAAAPLPAATGARGRLARLVLDLAAAHDRTCAAVLCSTTTEARRLEREITAAGDGDDVLAVVLPLRGGQEEAMARFTGGSERLRVLLTCGPLPPALDPDLLVQATDQHPAAHTAASLEAALTPSGPGVGPLLAVAAVDSQDRVWTELAALAGAAAALDPGLRAALRAARDSRPDDGWEALEFALPGLTAETRRRARAVCAWAPTTWEEEMVRTRDRDVALHHRARPATVSPSGLSLGTWLARHRAPAATAFLSALPAPGRSPVPAARPTGSRTA